MGWVSTTLSLLCRRRRGRPTFRVHRRSGSGSVGRLALSSFFYCDAEGPFTRVVSVSFYVRTMYTYVQHARSRSSHRRVFAFISMFVLDLRDRPELKSKGQLVWFVRLCNCRIRCMRHQPIRYHFSKRSIFYCWRHVVQFIIRIYFSQNKDADIDWNSGPRHRHACISVPCRQTDGSGVADSHGRSTGAAFLDPSGGG